jgi:hypothetical protein
LTADAPPKRVLLVHLVANGDCLMATTIARQIKHDHPGCHLTWAIGFKCQQVIENNPFVDEIWSVAYDAGEVPYGDVWVRTKEQAEARKRAGEFDLIVYTQFFPDNFNNFDGTTRSTLFRAYPGPITVPVEPVMRLRDAEIERVSRFAAAHGLARYQHVVLFECAPGSAQSFLTPEVAVRIAERVTAARPEGDTAFVISSHLPARSANPAVVDGSPLSYRENAELSKHCSFLLGGSSGITWLTTSSAAKRLPTIQFLSPTSPWYSFASMKYDHEHFGLDTSQILETDLHDEAGSAAMVLKYLSQGSFAGLASRTFTPSIEQIYELYKMKAGAIDVRGVLRNFVARNPRVPVDTIAFYRGLARIALRREAGKVVRRVLAGVKRAAAARPR